MTPESDARPVQDPEEQLECALIDEFLCAHGYDWRRWTRCQTPRPGGC